MASDMETLTTIRSNLLTAIATATANPKPNYSINGQQVSHADYLRDLLARVNDVNNLISTIGGSFEVVQQGLV
jgi:hypothetical protein